MARTLKSMPLTSRCNIPRQLKATVWAMTYGKCWYCGVTLNPFEDFIVEHIQPLSRGGTNLPENLAPSCCMCNQDKGTKTLEEWRPLFADSEGLGPDPSAWLFWFERDKDSPSWREGYKNYQREVWREHEIENFYNRQDDERYSGL